MEYIMARPMFLIQPLLLDKLWEGYKAGVPVCRLIRDNDLSITPPTLTKLLKHYTMYANANDDTLERTIHKSLFPEWLTLSEDLIVKQPPNYRYTGIMPIGKWEKNEWTNIDKLEAEHAESRE